MGGNRRLWLAAIAVVLLLGVGFFIFVWQKGGDEIVTFGSEDSIESTDAGDFEARPAAASREASEEPEESSGSTEAAEVASPSSIGEAPSSEPSIAPGAGEITGRVLNRRTRIAVASVKVAATPEGPVAVGALSKVTDKAGRFRITGLEAGRKYALTFIAPGYEKAKKAGLILATTQGMDLGDIEINPLPVVKGTVVDMKGQPVHRAKICMTPDSSIKIGPNLDFGEIMKKLAIADSLLFETRTGTDGGFVIYTGEIPKGLYTLRASAPPHATAILYQVSVAPGAEVEAKEIMLVKAHSLKGKVVDTSGNPVAQASVVALGDPDKSTIMTLGRVNFAKHWTETDETGSFLFTGLVPNTYMIFVNKDTLHCRLEDKVSVPTDKEILFELTPSFTLSGRVLDLRTGTPIMGAKVAAVSDSGFGQCLTDKEGKYSLPNLSPGDYQFIVKASGYMVSASEEGQHLAGGDVTKDFNLAKGAKVTGRILDGGTGKPLAGVKLTAYGFESGFDPMSGGTTSAVSAADGTFVLEGVKLCEETEWSREIRERTKTGRFKLTIIATKNGWEQQPPTAFFGGKGENLKDIEIIMKGAPRALGKVMDAKGQPIAGAKITAFSPDARYQMAFLTGEKPATVTSDEDGNFQIFMTSSLRILLLVEAQGYDFDAKIFKAVEPGMVKSGLTLTLSKGGSMQGQVLDQEGSPRAGVSMKIIFSGKFGGGDEWPGYLMFLPSFKAAHRELRTDAKGCITAHNLRPGQWTVSEKGPNPIMGKNGKTFTVVLGETAQVKIERGGEKK